MSADADVLLSMYLKGTVCPQKRGDGVFISSDKAAFMSADGAALCSVANGENALLNRS